MRRCSLLGWCIMPVVGFTYCAGENLPCSALNQAVLGRAAGGQLSAVETELSAALGAGESICAGVALKNLAAFMSVSGRSAEAENYAQRSVKLLEENYPGDDHVLLRPLQILAAACLDQGKITKSRDVFDRMLRIRPEGSKDRALVHGMAASLLQAEGNMRAAESECLVALDAWTEAGLGESADAATLLGALAVVYIEQDKIHEASEMIDRALAVFAGAKDAVPFDRIKALNCRAVLHARQGEWGDAERKFREAIAMTDQEPQPNPALLSKMLSNHEFVLRKLHRRKEASAVAHRRALMGGDSGSIVDIAGLLGARQRSGQR